MPSVVQEQGTYGGELATKERSTEPSLLSGISSFTSRVVEPSVAPSVSSGFTAVNGRTSASPSEVARPNGHVESRQASEGQVVSKVEQHRGTIAAAEWQYRSGDKSRTMTPPDSKGKDSAAPSPQKRKRSPSSGSSLSPMDDFQNHKRINGYSPSQSQSSPAMSTHGPSGSSNHGASAPPGDYSPAMERREPLPYPRNTSESTSSENRLADVLQMKPQDRDQHTRGATEMRNGDEHGLGASHNHLEPYSGDGPRPMVLGDPKKRKRVRLLPVLLFFLLCSKFSFFVGANTSPAIRQPNENRMSNMSKEKEEVRRGQARV